MKYVIERSAEGFEILIPAVGIVEQSLGKIAINDIQAASVPFLKVGLNMMNPLGTPAIWDYTRGFSAVPLGIKNSGFKIAGVSGNCEGFEASIDEVVLLAQVRYGSSTFNTNELQRIRAFAKAVEDTYRNIADTAEVSEVSYYDAIARLDDYTLAYIAREDFWHLISVATDSGVERFTRTARNFIDASCGLTPSGRNMRLEIADASDLYKACLFSAAGNPAYSSLAVMIRRILTFFVLTSQKEEWIKESEKILKEYKSLDN